MTDDLAAALARLSDRLRPHVPADPELRAAVAAVGRALVAWADGVFEHPGAVAMVEAAPRQTPPPDPEPVAPVPEPAPVLAAPASDGCEAGTVQRPVPREVKPPTTAPRPLPPPPPAPAFESPEPEREFTPDPLPTIARRCRAKMGGCEQVKQRLVSPLAADGRYRDAGPAEGDLWMLSPGDYSTAPKVWDDLRGAFAVAGAAANLLAALLELPEKLAADHRRVVLYLAAEAQALLFGAVADARRASDNDQVQLYVHIREVAREHRIYIDRYLRRDDRVPADGWPDLMRRLSDRALLLEAARQQTKARDKRLGNLRYKLTKLAADPAAGGDEWARVLELIEEAVAAGLPPSNAELRDLLLPVLDAIPADLPHGPNADRVLRAVDEYLATRPAPESAAAPEPPSAEVAELAALLRGKEMVLIGGENRPGSHAALEEAFGLSELIWMTTRPHESVTVFKPAVARSAVAVVVLAIRWSSHSYGDVQDYCTEYGKPLVRLPAGYNPNQVAHHVLNQAGARLRAGAAV